MADPSSAAAFWAALLNRRVVAESGAALLPGELTQDGLRFIASTMRAVGRPRLHLHLTSTSLEDQQRIITTTLRLGGRHHDVGQTGEEGFVVIADPEDIEFCVIEPDNSYLAGTGYLGETICEGSRAVGLFWRDVLGWPLVWDKAEQTAIQSPAGGAKIAWDSWDGTSTEHRDRRGRQRFDLISTDAATDVDRLLLLGATWRARLLDVIELADRDGSPFTIRPTTNVVHLDCCGPPAWICRRDKAVSVDGRSLHVLRMRVGNSHFTLSSPVRVGPRALGFGTWWPFVFPVTFAGSASSKHVPSVGGESPRQVASSLVGVH